MAVHRSYPRTPGFRLGIYVFKDAEIVDFAAPHGVFSVARRFDPELDAFLIADAMRPVQAQAGFTVCRTTASRIGRRWTPSSSPAASARARRCTTGACTSSSASLPETTLLTSVCTGSWIYGAHGPARRPAGDQPQGARPARSLGRRQGADRPAGRDRARCRISRARVVDAGRIVTAGGIASGMEMGFHLLRRAGYDEAFIGEVARVMEYAGAYEGYRDDILYADA